MLTWRLGKNCKTNNKSFFALRSRWKHYTQSQEISIDFPFCFRRENIIEEICNTELNYVEDLKMVLTGYRDKMERSNLAFLKTELIFGNLDEIWDFHADTLLPQLESCDMNPTLIAKTFLEYCQHLTRMYCRLVYNISVEDWLIV